jgi:hypothetical protein
MDISRVAAMVRAALAAVLPAARPRAVSLTARLDGDVTPAGAVREGPLGAGSEYGLSGSGVARPATFGPVRLAAGLRVAVGPDPATGTVRLALTETLVRPAGDRLTVLRVLDAGHVGADVLHGTGQWTVIGGTGGLAAASGSGTGELTLDLGRRRFTSTLAGRIRLR